MLMGNVTVVYMLPPLFLGLCKTIRLFSIGWNVISHLWVSKSSCKLPM